MFTLKFKTSNAAFDEDNFGPEVSRILSELSQEAGDWQKDEHVYKVIKDVNGNTVGELECSGYLEGE